MLYAGIQNRLNAREKDASLPELGACDDVGAVLKKWYNPTSGLLMRHSLGEEDSYGSESKM